MAEKTHEEHITSWLNGEITDQDLSQQIGTDHTLKYQQILAEVDTWTPDNGEIFDAATITAPAAKSRTFPIWSSLAVAASVFTLIAIGFWYFAQQQDSVVHVAGRGEIKTIDLPDGKSTVTLAPGAIISWLPDDWAETNRALSLEGKAYFDVEPGSPFAVNATNGTVEVLGTTFTIDQFESSLEVVCYEGRVRATNLKGTDVTVNAGEGYRYHEGTWESLPPTYNEPTWINGKSSFHKAPLTQVLANLQQHYEINISDTAINTERRFTGTIPHDNLQVALQLVFEPLGIRYTLQGKQLTLSE
ncbi:FecR family protein [Marinoscillum furvescens]|uniref:FecR family protein n=1 Tax=Marinoscillum furvescens DSM 4134 TaxID=1122208 RepID=A0A3D9KXD3_MARFU|nr:FecR domain-containing protein [Marinoscillum furvescens]RED91494.1 FecR family protein [Marinoscillum furvescens DSM 4134]